jgi:hypothetical protein
LYDRLNKRISLKTCMFFQSNQIWYGSVGVFRSWGYELSDYTKTFFKNNQQPQTLQGRPPSLSVLANWTVSWYLCS